MNQYYVTLYAPLVGVDRSILEYGVGTILAIYGKPLGITVFDQFHCRVVECYTKCDRVFTKTTHVHAKTKICFTAQAI